MQAPPDQYSRVAIALHWALALCIIALIPMGLWMKEAIAAPETQALAYRLFQLHKSLGFLVLALTIVRIIWRVGHPAPALPAAMPRAEKFAAGAAHAALYALMLGLPLTGWLYVSTGWAVASDRALSVPTSWFGLFTIPALPFVADASAAVRRGAAFQSMGAHAALAWGAVVLIALHVGAALKHHFISRDDVLAQMIPLLARNDASAAERRTTAQPSMVQTGLAHAAGFGVIAALGVAAAIAAQPAPRDFTATGAQQLTTVAAPSQEVEASTPAVARAPAWVVDHAISSISFSGEHSGAPFTGRFESWRGDIHFSPDDLAGSRAEITIDAGSARTGDATQETALEGEEWLDPKSFPEARFIANVFQATGEGRFEANGALRLKGFSIPVRLPFTFSETNGVARVQGKAELDRAALNVGMQSDADGAWVSKTIEVTIDVTARRK